MKKDSWNSRIGVILAVAGSAVGLGNFLRFPGKAAEFGGGAFMLAYLIAFLIIGLPICWAEWTMGRHGGRNGFNAAPGILGYISKHPLGKYFGIIAVLIPVGIYMYYVCVEAWCLGYAVNYLRGDTMKFASVDEAGAFFGSFVGAGANGSGIGFQLDQVGFYLILVFALNFFLIYRGVSKGIEFFCKYAMPALVLIAVIILVNVMMLGTPNPEHPERNINNGLGFMWNPTKTFVQERIYEEPLKAVQGEDAIAAMRKDFTNSEKYRIDEGKLAVEAELVHLESGERMVDATFTNPTEIETKIEQFAANPDYNVRVLATLPTATLMRLYSEGKWTEMYEIVGKESIAEAQAAVAGNANLRIYEKSILEQLKNPNLWLEAAGQIFFSLSVGFGVIITYASYMKKDDDLVLSGLAATSANEFCEVALGGLISIPAGVAFMGVAGMAGMVSTFGLGFNALPMVFAQMQGGMIIGFLFFFLLFLAAVTSSLSMLQPGIAFLEETLSINRRQSVAILGFMTAIGALFVIYFSADLKALDTLDFWLGNFLIFVLATTQIIIFSWVFGLKRGLEEAHHGAAIRIPKVFGFLMKWVTPAFLLVVFIFWALENMVGFSFTKEVAETTYRITDLTGDSARGIEPNMVAWMSIALIGLLAGFLLLITAGAERYKNLTRKNVEETK